MNESEVQRRLESLETRVSLVLALIVVGYGLAIAVVLVETTDVVTPWNAGVGAVALLIVAAAVGISRRRRAR